LPRKIEGKRSLIERGDLLVTITGANVGKCAKVDTDIPEAYVSQPNALDQAAPLAGWELPEGFAQLRRLMDVRLGKKGKREYVQTLRLLETFPLSEVARAIDDALRLGAISFDAVKHLLLCRIEQRPARLDLENYPHLPAAQVATRAAADYLTLLSQGAR
jgi:hypothetical protein